MPGTVRPCWPRGYSWLSWAARPWRKTRRPCHWDEFQRHPWEIAGGANFYPFGNRQWRINLHVIRIDQSPAGSTFGYYTAGQTGTTVSLGTDFLL